MVTQQQLSRSSSDKVIAGVCGGLGQYFGIDPVIVRLIMVGLVFAGGISILLYPVLWLVMPVDGFQRPLIGQGLSEMQREAQSLGQQAHSFGQQAGAHMHAAFSQARFDPQTGQPLDAGQTHRRNNLLGIVLVGVGVLMLASYFGGSQIALALMVLGGGLYLLRRNG